MRKRYASEKLKFCVGDLSNLDSIIDLFKGVDYVFHAATLKQISSCELNPMEAYRTNVVGANNVITACVRSGVKKTIFLSSDEAVYPVNVVGLSKAMMEKAVIAKSHQMQVDETTLCIVRCADAIGSRGSITPLLLEKAIEGKTLILPSPSTTRFVITPEEVVDLSLEALETGQQGDLFIPRSPATSLMTLAQAIISVTKSRSSISYSGLSTFEKLHETLVSSEEVSIASETGNLFGLKAREAEPVSNMLLNFNPATKNAFHSYNSCDARQLSLEEMMALLKKQEMFQKLFQKK